ncbi:MAG TPA: endonuclease/exonuclease/phosphatase family protein, partial [Candidatus Binatia bacterium]|nr:endonuclease/exonuclease/phosphatase family protein [Candidatus Binatia bacterium]
MAWSLGLPLLGLALYLAFMTVSDYRPDPAIRLEIENNQAVLLKKNMPLSVLTFNIGYAGLDAGADFFMDGGSASRASSLGQVRTNLEQIAAFLSAPRADLILLQEVDVRSSRSFRIDESAYLKKILAGHGVVFAVNYRVPWVPVPLFRPMGAVRSGLLTLSRFRVQAAIRYRLPGREAWPRQLAELDRCLSESRLPVQGGKELVLIHLHLSVFDQGGRIRKRQLAFLRERIMAEYGGGNHVIVGGDWNHGLPGTDPARFRSTEARPGWYMALPGDFTPPGFTWAIDDTMPSIRSNGTAYRNGVNFVAVIDGFLVSP